MDRISPEVLIMIFKHVSLRDSTRIAFVSKLWLGCVRDAHRRELEFISLFDSSRIKKTCLMPLDLLRSKFYDYMTYMHPERENDITLVTHIYNHRFVLRKKIIECLSEEYIFIRKNLDKLILDYMVMFVKYDILFRFTDPEEK